jgi:hypothetical protein
MSESRARKKQKKDRLLIVDLSQLDSSDELREGENLTVTNSAGRTRTVITSISPLKERESMPHTQVDHDLSHDPDDVLPSLGSSDPILECPYDPQAIQVPSQTRPKRYENSV